MVALLLKDLLARCPRKQLDTLLDVALAWSPTRPTTYHSFGNPPTLNPNPKPSTLNHKPKPLEPKPQTLNPKS